MPLNKKPAVYRDPAVEWLGKLSKAALVDCVIDLMRPSPSRESADEPLTVDETASRLECVVKMRGDAMPVTRTMKIERAKRPTNNGDKR